MGLTFSYDYGQTPLDGDEREGLRIPTINTLAELNDFEEDNIRSGIHWAISQRRLLPEEVLTETFILMLHKKLFGDVWQWAGTFRKTNKNIGVDKWEIASQLRQLLEDTQFWIAHNIFSADEIAIRFKHRLVSIHCFANGNGRHSRIMAEILAQQVLGSDRFMWGASLPDSRATYLKALKAADQGNYTPLLAFAKQS